MLGSNDLVLFALFHLDKSVLLAEYLLFQSERAD